MRVVGQWRRLQQTGSVAAYADHVFRLKALCDIGEVAEFKLTFYGLQPELQAEVRKHLRQNKLHQLDLEQLFAIAQDAEVGLAGRAGRKGAFTGEGSACPFDKAMSRERKGAPWRTVCCGMANGLRWGLEELGGGNQTQQVRTASGATLAVGGSTQSSWGITTSTGEGSLRGEGYQGPRRLRQAKTLSKGALESEKGRGPPSALCFICEKAGHGWFNCPQKKTGKGCFKCGSEGHHFSQVPATINDSHSVEWVGHDFILR